MKFFSWIVGIVLAILLAAYVVAFTPVGNGIVAPIVEGKIKENTKLDSKLSVFSLSMSEFEILLALDSHNSVHIKGNYSLFSKAFDIAYGVDFEKLESLKSLTNAPLKGTLKTDGSVRGDLSYMEINGVSDFASSDTTYHIELTDLNPTSIIAKIKDANLVSLLQLGGQKPYADAKVDVDVNFKNIVPHALDGDILMITKNAKLNTELMNKDFNLTIPKTDFTMKLDAKLKGDAVDYKYILSSNLAKIESAGNVIPEPLKTDINYSVDVKELAVLQPITKADVRGAFRLNGTLKGTKENMLLEGKSDLAESDTVFTAKLKDFAPVSLKAKMKNLQLAKLLYMVKQPHYADGIFSLDIDMSDLREGNLKGSVVSSILDGVVDSKYITKTYEFKTQMPMTAFTMNTNTSLNGDIADTKIDLHSSLADFNIKQARVNLKDGSIVSDYATTVPNLDKLYFASERHLKGSLSAYGELKRAKDLDLSLHSKIAGGNIDARMHNDDIHADIKAVQTLEVLSMLIYPEIFKSSLNGVFDYNIAQQKGKFKADLSEGQFTQNQMLDLVRQFGKVDLYKEKFKGDLTADINKENIVASLDLISNTSSIKTKDTKLNSKTKKIDSKIDIVANKNPITIKLSGDATAPKVEIDAQKIIEKEVQKAIEKKLDKKVGNLLKGFFN